MKLNIELVPRTAWFKNLRSHLSQAEWDVVRRKCYKQANYRCEICSGKGPKHPVEAHERWVYEQGEVKLVGLIALCPSCHECHHMGLAKKNGNAERAVAHFSKVNQITRQEAISIINLAFDLWRERSEQEWELNVDYLQEYLKN